jgi:stage IV sporulation protein FB
MSNDFDSIYPQKPVLRKEVQKSGHLAVTVFSLILFAGAFLFFFDRHIGFLLQLIAVLLVHELGHFLMMKRFGYQNVRMLFIPFMGAFVHGSKEEYRQRQSIWVILAGPLPGILLAAVFGFLGVEYQIPWMVEVATLSFVLNVINLLPLLPLDGGRLLNVLFFEKLELFQIVFAFLSSLVMIGAGWYFGFYLLLLFGFLMGFQVRGMYRKYLVHRSLRDSEVEYHTSYEKLSNRAYHFIRNEVLEHTPALRKILDESEEHTEEMKLVVAGEVSNMLIPPQIRNAGTIYRVIILLVWVAALILPFLQVLQPGFLEMLAHGGV